MTKFNKQQKEATVALINKGYEKAAASFATMTRQEISIKPIRVELIAKNEKMLAHLKQDKQLILITTSIIGEYSGKSYLIFNEVEAEEVYKACMNYNPDSASRSMETEALLKELDNILSAAVITEFSNAMDAMIFGDVPVLSHLSQTDLKALINKDIAQLDSDYFILADTQFVFANHTNLRPQFLWKLTAEFVDNIKNQSAPVGQS